MSTLTTERIFLNQIAQGVVALEEGESWFLDQADEHRRILIREISMMALQAGFVPSDVGTVVESLGLKKGATPCFLLSCGRPKTQMAKVLALPQNESLIVFRLLIGLFSVADERRRGQCGAKCQHWWHRDLSNKAVVADLLDSDEV